MYFKIAGLLISVNQLFTGKSVSKALILESVNPQYDKRLFIEFHEKYKLTICCVQFCFVLTFKTIFVNNMFGELIQPGIFFPGSVNLYIFPGCNLKILQCLAGNYQV